MAFDSRFLKSRLTALNCGDIAGRYAVALSGGADSVALLIALSEYVPGNQLLALHFDHAIHTDSADWSQYCQDLCARKKIKFYTARWQEQDVAIKQQEASAREARYRWFAETMDESDVLLTGHHADDQTETVLMSLFEGRSLRRVAGMSANRPLQLGSQQSIVRPLLDVRRAELQQFLQQRGVEWIEDPANANGKHSRSWIRTEVMPRISQRWPSVVSNIDRVSTQLMETLEIVDDVASKAVLTHARAARRTLFCRTDPLYLEPLISGSEGQFCAILRQWVYQGGIGSPGRKQLSEFFRQLREVGSEHHCRLSVNDAEVVFYDEHLFLIEERGFQLGEALPARLDQNTVCCGLRLTYAIDQKGFHRNMLQSQNIHWRKRRNDDRFTVSTSSGSTSLKKAMQQAKLAPWLRHSLPLLVQNEEVVWAHGLGVNARFQAHDGGDAEGVLPMFTID